MSETAQVIFWSVLGGMFLALAVASLWWTWEPMKRFGRFKDEGPDNYIRTEGGDIISEASELHDVLTRMTWISFIGFALAGAAAVWTAAS